MEVYTLLGKMLTLQEPAIKSGGGKEQYIIYLAIKML